MWSRIAAIAGLILACVAASASSAQTEKRVALVIGNAAYKEAPLKNPVNDARAMAAKLRELGFEVVTRENAGRQAMESGLAEFTRKLSPGAAALIYYAGHGIQARGKNYLIPVDAALEGEASLRFQAVDLSALTEELEQAQARVSFLILDACRNNPFERRMRGGTRGLAAVDAAQGTMIAYATAPGSVAADGEGSNGVYTASLLNALTLPGLKAEEVFKRVRLEVVERTHSQQTPWESSSLTGDFVFNLASLPAQSTVSPPPTVAPAMGDREALFWNSVKDSRRAEDFADYLTRYPSGEFAGLARRRLEDLRSTAAVGRPAPAPTHPTEPPTSPDQNAAIPNRTSAGGVKGATGHDGRWQGRFISLDPKLGSGSPCHSSRTELEVVDGQIVDGSIRLDDGRRFEFKSSKLGRVAFEGVIAPDGDLNVKMRMYDNFSTNFMNIRYAGQVRQNAVEGDWSDDFGHCQGTFKLERKH